MNHSADDPDDLVQKNINLNHNHIINMSSRMHVPDSITVGPNRPLIPRFHQDNDRLPVRMEVPNSIRLGDHVNTELLNGTNSSINNDSNHLSDIETQSDDEYATINTPRNNQQHQPIRIADSWHIEPFTDIDDKNVLNKLQLLQNRIHHIERTLARRNFRDRVVYTCIIGYFLLQTILSVRRSMLN